MKCVLALLLLSSLAVNAWNESEGGVIKWNSGCKWSLSRDNAIASKYARPDDCGGFCVLTSGCKAFDHGEGQCFLYNRVSDYVKDGNWMCGYREY